MKKSHHIRKSNDTKRAPAGTLPCKLRSSAADCQGVQLWREGTTVGKVLNWKKIFFLSPVQMTNYICVKLQRTNSRATFMKNPWKTSTQHKKNINNNVMLEKTPGTSKKGVSPLPNTENTPSERFTNKSNPHKSSRVWGAYHNTMVYTEIYSGHPPRRESLQKGLRFHLF